MTLLRQTLAVAAALGLAAAPRAQHAPSDADEPGAVRPAAQAIPSVVVDDQDPGAPRLRARSVPVAPTVSDADADAPPFVATAAAAAYEAPLDDGRAGDGAPPAARPAAPASSPLDDGRSGPASDLATRTAEPYDGPLDDGRPAGARPGPEVAEDAPVALPVSAPLLDARGEAATTIEMIRPNPTPGRVEISLQNSASSARVAVYDLRGRLVRLVYEGPTDPDVVTRFALDLSDVASGTYLVVVDADGARVSRPLQVVR